MKPINQISPQEIIDFLKKVDKKTWLKAGAGAAVAGLLIVFVVLPAWFERPRVRAQIKNLEGQMMLTKALFLKQPQLFKNKGDFSRLITEAKSRLYVPGESSLLLGAISKLAVQSGVSVVASMPKESSANFPAPYDTSYEGNGYDFTIEGGFHNLGQFISKIESNPKLLRVEKFTLKSRIESPNSHLGEVSLSAVSLKKDKAAR